MLKGLLGDYLPDWLPADQQKADAARAGLLNFGATMLANANQGFGGALGQGLLVGSQGYQDVRQDQQKRAMQDLQMKTLGLENQTKEMSLNRQKRIEDAFKSFYGQNPPGSAPQLTPGPQLTPPVQPAVPTDNAAFPRQPMPAWMPQPSLPAQPARLPAAATTPASHDNYGRYLQLAQHLEGRGLAEESQKYYDLAEKFRPKLKEQKVLRDQSGNVVTANVYEDGRTEVVNGFAPAEKLAFQNTGGETLGIDPYTGKPLARMRNTQSPDNAATVAATLRGQNLVDARSSQQVTQGKIPAGYREKPDGTFEAVPGGPADLKLQGAFNQDTAALNGSISGFDRLATAANELLQHPGLVGITGLRGRIPNAPGSDAANAQAQLNTLKSQVGFGVLQDMRNNSKTGGALGAVSDAEGKRLEANLAALENAQSFEQFQSSLKKIIAYSQQAKDRTYGAYNLKHGNQAGATKTNPGASSAAPAGRPSLDSFNKR